MEYYGNGPSTGLDQTALGKITTGFVPEDVTMSDEDKIILKELAERVEKIADSDEMAERRQLWQDLNTLQNSRPVIFCDPENGWNEIITETQMECKGKLARRWEMDLRKEIFWGVEMGDDKAVEPCFDVPYTVSEDDWGMKTIFHSTEMDSGAQSWDAPVKDYDKDMPKLHSPSFEIDWETTNGCMDIAEDVLGDFLDVRLKGTWWWSLGLTLPGVMLRGMTNLFMDFLDQPDNIKQLMALISKGHLDKIEYLEKENLLSINNDGTYVGSGGYGYTNELPQNDFVGDVRLKDMWGFTESQETVSVSPDMYEEFIFPYEKPIMEKFGLNCYGCCEPIDPRWHVVKQHPNLRRVSCSPWADYEKMAEYLQKDYVFSMKPAPAALSQSAIDKDTIRKELQESLAKAKGCCVELIMKDNHTIANRPENLTEWCAIAKEEAKKL